MRRLHLFPGLYLVGLLTAFAAAAAPLTFVDEGGTRFVTVEILEAGKATVALRTVGGPGSYGRWTGYGEQTPKGIEFSQKVEDDAPPAPVYLATGGQAKLTVKLKPGQAGVQDGGLAGVYRHISDEKVASLAKKDYEASEKRLDEAIKQAAHKAAAEDKPAFAEWKKAWPATRDRFLALSGAKVADLKTASVKPAPGQSAPSMAPDKLAAAWMQRAEITAGAAGFVAGGIPVGAPPGWEGPYEDGFGGSIQIYVVNNGDARFTLNAGRGQDGAGGGIEGRIPAAVIKTAKDGTATGEFTDNNTELKEGEQQTRLHFRRIGRVLIIESQYAERYAGRGWFDGIYFKRVPPKED